MKKVVFLIQVALILWMVNANGQTNQTWVFGNNAALTIGPSGPANVPGFGNNFTAGTASASDDNGNLLFYTDGSTVYNATGGTMTGGTGLNGNNSYPTSSSPLIVPVPGSPCEYYLFIINDFQDITNGQLNNGLTYYIVNVSTQQVSTGVSITPSGVSILQDKICGTTDGNGGYWVVVHGANLNNPSTDFYSYHITTAGVLSPILSLLGSPSPNCGGTTIIEKLFSLSGQLKFSPNSNFLASTTMYCNQFELFGFNNSTGQVLGIAANANQSIQIAESDMNSTNPGTFGGSACFGVEFSPNSQFLYVATSDPFGTPSGDDLFQFDLTSPTKPSLLSSCCLVASIGTAPQYGMLQLGPDGKIYMARQGMNALATISSPNTKQDCINNTTSCGFADNSYSLNGSCNLGLSSSVNGQTTTIAINPGVDGSTNYCSGSTLALSVYNLPTLTTGESITWQTPGGTQSSNPTLTVPNLATTDGGTYSVTVTFANCGTFQSSVVINVNNCPPPPNPCPYLHTAFYSTKTNPVQFTNATTSIVPVTYFIWNLGDGTITSDPNPVHQYNVVADYNVCLEAIILNDSGGCCFDSTCHKICCVPPPQFNCDTTFVKPAFSALTYQDNPGEVSFVNNTLVLEGVAPQYYWIFGDGGGTSAPNPTNIYANAGTYNVCLDIINPFTHDTCDSVCQQITVNSGLSMLRAMAFISPNFLNLDPNPSTEYVDVNYKNVCSSNAMIAIFNAYGQQEYTLPVNTDLSTVRVNVNNWASGLYTVKLMADGQVLQAKKFCKIE